MAGSLLIRGGRVLHGSDWIDHDVLVVDGVVTSDAAGRHDDVDVLDATGLLVVPGLVDLQCNGAGGIDLRSEPERLWEASSVLPRFGVTAWLPTIPTSAPGVVDRALDALAAGPPEGWRGAVPLGLHLEGPFLSPDAAGAHPVDLLRAPSAGEVAGWSRRAGVAVVTLAPELAGARDVISGLSDAGVVVSIGHSRATAAQVDAAIEAGARSVTHLFNAMSGLHHREPGVAGAALGDQRLTVGLIADGAHVVPEVVGIAQRALGDRMVLVSDAVAPLGTPAGADPGSGVRLGDGTLAGSVLPLVRAVANLVDWSGCSVADAVAAASARPALLLGDADRGSLESGSRGDVAVLTPDLDLHSTVVAGEILHSPAPPHPS